MRKIKGKAMLCATMLLTMMMTACENKKVDSTGKMNAVKQDAAAIAPAQSAAEKTSSPEATVASQNTQEAKEDEQGQCVSDTSGEDTKRGEKITSQSFEVKLSPNGTVVFNSYAPAMEHGDVVFVIKKGEKEKQLQGITSSNQREGITFKGIKAVSFPDYNRDGYQDIITIVSYKKANGSAYEEARIYSGNKNGAYTLEKELTENANSAIAEFSIDTVLSFLGANKKEAYTKQTSEWKQAFIDQIRKASKEESPEGFAIIDLNGDKVPEIVQIGASEAAGTTIYTYSNGEVRRTDLRRLGMTYIPKGNLLSNSDGNMDEYYDVIYSIKDGVLTKIASGHYGAKDNSKLEFDASGNPIYMYEWNGKIVREEQYIKALKSVYNHNKAVSVEKSYSGESIIKKLNEW